MSTVRWIAAMLVASTLGVLPRSAGAQSSSLPRAGSYYCYATTTGTEQRGPYATAVLPAFFGKLVFDDRGAYRFTQRSGGGRVSLDDARRELTFTGDMNTMTGRNFDREANTFLLGSKSFSFLCTLEVQRSAANGSPQTAPTPTRPTTTTPATVTSANGARGANAALRGTLITTLSNRNNMFIGKVLAYDLFTGSTSVLFQDGVAHGNAKGEILHIDNRARMSITDRAGQQTLQTISDKEQSGFDDYFPAISHSGEYFAVTTGVRAASSGIMSLAEGPGKQLVIARRSGQAVATLPGLVQGAWIPNGGLVAAGDGTTKRGLYVIEPDFRTVRRLMPGYDDATTPAISPDGNTVAFSTKDEVWTVTITGTSPTRILFGSGTVANWPVWSPDGRFLACAVAYTPRYGVAQHHIMVVDIRADTAFFPVDHGSRIVAQQRISWLP